MVNRVLLGAAAAMSLAVLILGGLVFAAMSYDRSNPRDRANAYYIENSIEIDAPVEAAFSFFRRRIPDVYTEVAGMHGKFEIVNADSLVTGAEIESEEGDESRVVRHRYVVTRVIPARLLQLESTPSVVYDRDTGEEIARVNTDVYYDFEPLDEDRTRLTQTVVIDMLNPFDKAVGDVIAFVSGSRGEWSDQFVEELEGYAAFIEREHGGEAPDLDDPGVY
jgi:hypothetical protein